MSLYEKDTINTDFKRPYIYVLIRVQTHDSHDRRWYTSHTGWQPISASCFIEPGNFLKVRTISTIFTDNKPQ
jgi:hypothetical protein